MRHNRVISLRKFLLLSDEEREEAILRGLKLLLHGIWLHAVEGDRTDYDAFRADLAGLEAKLDEANTPPEILFLIGSVLKALEEYNNRTMKTLRQRASELQSMVGMLTRTVSSVSVANDRTATRLHDIEQQLEKTSEIESIVVLRLRLSECLDAIRQEAEEHKKEAASTVQELHQGLQIIQSAAEAHTQIDSVTGLPLRARAEQAFAQAIQLRRSYFAAVFVVERVQSINVRFGYAVGDEVLRCFQRWLVQNLSASDRLFRWNGPAIVVLLERPGPLEKVRGEISKLTKTRLEQTVAIGSRSVLLPVSTGWTVMPVAPPGKLLLHRIDGFVSGALPAES